MMTLPLSLSTLQAGNVGKDRDRCHILRYQYFSPHLYILSERGEDSFSLSTGFRRRKDDPPFSPSPMMKRAFTTRLENVTFPLPVVESPLPSPFPTKLKRFPRTDLLSPSSSVFPFFSGEQEKKKPFFLSMSLPLFRKNALKTGLSPQIEFAVLLPPLP